MFIKTKTRFHQTYFYLAQSRRQGKKMTQRCDYIGNRLDLSREDWLLVVRRASGRAGIKPPTIRDFFLVVQSYREKHGLPFETMAGLKAAMKFVVSRGPDYAVLGLQVGATPAAIQSAFRALCRRHHPDVGGDPARMREIVAARDRILGPTPSATSGLQAARRGSK